MSRPRLLLVALASGLLAAGVVLAVALGGGGDDGDARTGPNRLAAPSVPQVADATSGAAAGYSLVVDGPVAGRIGFRIRRDGDRPFTLAEWQERPLHAFLVRRDLAVFERLDLTGEAEERFEAPVPELEPGPYRLVVDFTVGKVEVALGADVTVPGEYRRQPLPTVGAPWDLGDGRAVAVSHRTPLYQREDVPVSFTLIDADGALPLERHLTAFGFLALVHADSLAYTHGHPVVRDQPLFAAIFPREGPWAAFYEYRLGGETRVARFLLDVNPASS
jgi:hypothetical protein